MCHQHRFRALDDTFFFTRSAKPPLPRFARTTLTAPSYRLIREDELMFTTFTANPLDA